MYIKTGKACGYWYAVAYKDESENERLHRVEFVDDALQLAWQVATGEEEKRIERKGENFALQQLLDEMVERKQISVADALAEMAKFMGGDEAYPEPEPTPEPEKPKLAYAVGDEVLVKGVIVMVDEDDETYPYHVRINNFSNWVEVEDIAGKASPAAGVKEDPKPEPVKYEAGTKVRSKIRPHLGVGTYLFYYKSNDYDNLPHEVEFSGSTHWLSDGEIEVVTESAPAKPEPKFKVGDKVIHKFKPVWGVGEVLEIHQKTAQYDFFGGDNPETMPATRVYKVRFSHWVWTTAEENLVLA